MGNLLNGEFSWLAFRVIAQRNRYVARFYFYFIVIIRIDGNVADSIAQMIITGRIILFGIIKKSSRNVCKNISVAGLINFFSVCVIHLFIW